MVNNYLNTAKALTLFMWVPLLLSPLSSFAQQLCDDDGIELTFRNEKAGVVTLNKAKTREITGSGKRDRAESVAVKGQQTGNSVGSLFRVSSLNPTDFVDGFIQTAEIERTNNNSWEINLKRNRYVFANRRDLDIEVIINVTGDEANHISGGSSSRVSLEVEEGNLSTNWYGRSNSLKQLRGRLDFRFTDIELLALAGIHRATLGICVNIRGQM